MKLVQVAEANKKYYSKDFIHGFNTGAKTQYEADKKNAERRGRWERKGYHLHCSCCDWSTDLATPYCPGCGAYLGGDAK